MDRTAGLDAVDRHRVRSSGAWR